MRTAMVLCVALTVSLQTAAQGAASSAEAAMQLQADVRESVFKALAGGKSTYRPGAAGGLQGQPEAMAGREDLVPTRAAGACEPLNGDPLTLIADEARKTNIVIVNESHASPRQRHFIGELLRVLRREGYDTYAAETFAHQELNHPGVLGSDGWYSNEPIFGRTVRIAKELGYHLLPYEETAAQVRAAGAANPRETVANRREASQVANLMAATFAQRPDAKVVIHVGSGHVSERRRPGDANGTVAMAERLKTATGKDPLTISQDGCSASGKSSELARSRRTADGALTEIHTVDFTVGHPPMVLRDGRPEWRQLAGDRPIAVPGAFLESREEVIVEARPQGTPLAEVPVDRLFLRPGEHLPLLLPPGRYRIDGFNQAGRIDGDPVVVELK